MFSDSPLALSYAISSNPYPIQVSSDNSSRIADIEIVFSNNSFSLINLQELDIEIPVGDNAQELTADPTGIQCQVTPNGTPSPIWDISLNGGTVSLTSHTGTPVSITKDGFAIQLSDIKINKVLGTCYLDLTETIGTTVNSGILPCNKFPATFSLSNFVAVDSAGVIILNEVEPNTQVWLTWEANIITNSTLMLGYDQQVIDVTKCHSSVSNQYRYPSDTSGILINNDDKTFTLQANYKMPDGTVLQSAYQYVVSVIQPPKIENFVIINKRSLTNIIWSGEEVTIKWRTNDATDYCQLFRNNVQIKEPHKGEFSKHGVTYSDTPSCSATYRLVAYNNSGASDSIEDTSVEVYQWKTLKPPIPILIPFPSDIAITHDGLKAYVTNTVIKNPTFKEGFQHGLFVIDIRTNKFNPIDSLNTRPTFDFESAIIVPNAVDAYIITKKVYYKSDFDHHFSMVNIDKKKQPIEIFTFLTIGWPDSPSSMAFSKDKKYVCIIGLGSKLIVKVFPEWFGRPLYIYKNCLYTDFVPLSIALTSDEMYVTAADNKVYYASNSFDSNSSRFKAISIEEMRHLFSIAVTSDDKFVCVLGIKRIEQNTFFGTFYSFYSCVTVLETGSHTVKKQILLEKINLTASTLSIILGGIAITSDGKRAYVTSAVASCEKKYDHKVIPSSDYEGLVHRVDIVGNVRPFLLINLGSSQYPTDIAITSDGKYAYVTTIDLSKITNSKVYVIDIDNKKTLPEKSIPLTGQLPMSIAMIPGEQFFYVLNLTKNRFPSIIKIDISKQKILLRPAPKVWNVAVTKNGKYVCITNLGNLCTNFTDINSKKTEKEINLSIPINPAACASSCVAIDDKCFYISVDRIIYAVNFFTRERVEFISFEDVILSMVLSPNGKYLYVITMDCDAIFVVDVARKTILSESITVGSSPASIAITSDSKYAFVTNFGSHDVSMIDIEKNAVIPTSIKVGKFPTSIAITPDNKRIYVINAGSHSVSVLEKTKISAPETVLFAFKSKPTDKNIKKLQQWLGSITAMGNWQVERIANTLLIKFNSKDENQELEEKFVRTLFCYLKEMPEWNDIDKAEREGANLTIYCKENNIEKYEQILDEVLGIHKLTQTKFCAVS